MFNNGESGVYLDTLSIDIDLVFVEGGRDAGVDFLVVLFVNHAVLSWL